MDESTTQRTGLLGSFLGWVSHPYQTQGSALNWVLFVGLIVIAIWFWQVIMFDIVKEVA